MATKLIFEQIEGLLCKGACKEANELLLSVESDALDQYAMAHWLYLLSSVEFEKGVYNLTHIDNAIELLRCSDAHNLYAQAKFKKGQIQIALGLHSKAKETLLEAYVTYQRIRDYEGAASSVNRLALVHFQCGNIAAAVENLQRAIELYGSTGSLDRVAVLKNNLALVLFMSGEFNESISVYSASERSIDCLSTRNACAFHQGYSMALALSGNVSAARKRMRKTTKLMEESSREQAQYYEYLGWINLLDGKHKAAEKALASGLELSLRIAPKSALVSQIKRLQADVYVATEKFDLAERTAKEALVVAEAINERVEIAACYRVFAQVCAHRNETKLARDWFGKAIDLFALVQSRYELAVTRFLSSASGLYDLSERKAMLYLARNYFESEEVSSWIKKVDIALRTTARPAIHRAGYNGSKIIGESKAIKKVLEMVDHVAESHMSILLTGSTGTGKDMFARHIHNRSGFSGEFVSVNMAAIPDEMVEAELFGHTKGAFTGASTDRIGLIAQADNGTLYLNEIGDATMSMQAKLLEVIETRRVRRLGENKVNPVAFRLIAATNFDLEERIKENLFRLDLLHRINEIPILLPDLKDRGDDINLLITHFVSKAVGRKVQTEEIQPFCHFMQKREWPGNIRELRSEIHRFCTSAGGDLNRLLLAALSDNGRSEQEKMKEALASTGWNRSLTAKILGISEGTVRNRIRNYAFESDN